MVLVPVLSFEDVPGRESSLGLPSPTRRFGSGRSDPAKDDVVDVVVVAVAAFVVKRACARELAPPTVRLFEATVLGA